MMLGASSRVMEVYRVKLNSVRGNFEMEAEVTKVEKPHFMMIGNPRYKKLVEKHPHLKGVTMDETTRDPAYLCTSSYEKMNAPESAALNLSVWEESGTL